MLTSCSQCMFNKKKTLNLQHTFVFLHFDHVHHCSAVYFFPSLGLLPLKQPPCPALMMPFPVMPLSGTPQSDNTTKDMWSHASQTIPASGLSEYILEIVQPYIQRCPLVTRLPMMHFNTNCKQDFCYRSVRCHTTGNNTGIITLHSIIPQAIIFILKNYTLKLQ